VFQFVPVPFTFCLRFGMPYPRQEKVAILSKWQPELRRVLSDPSLTLLDAVPGSLILACATSMPSYALISKVLEEAKTPTLQHFEALSPCWNPQIHVDQHSWYTRKNLPLLIQTEQLRALPPPPMRPPLLALPGSTLSPSDGNKSDTTITREATTQELEDYFIQSGSIDLSPSMLQKRPALRDPFARSPEQDAFEAWLAKEGTLAELASSPSWQQDWRMVERMFRHRVGSAPWAAPSSRATLPSCS
jgi:hypothetical protein